MRYCPPVWLSLIPYLQWSCFKPALAWNHVPSIQTDHVRRHWNNLHDQIGFDFNMLCIESWGTDESVNSEKTQAEQDAFPKAKRIQAHEINAWTTKNTTCRYGRVKRVGLLIQRSWVRSPWGGGACVCSQCHDIMIGQVTKAPCWSHNRWRNK